MKYIFLLSAAISLISYIITSAYAKKLDCKASELWLDINNSIKLNTNPVSKKNIKRLLDLSSSVYDIKENKRASAFVFLCFVFFANCSLSASYFFQYFLLLSGSEKEPLLLNEITVFMAALPAAISVKMALSISESRDRFLSVHDHLSPMNTDIPLSKLQYIKLNTASYNYLIKIRKTKRTPTNLEWSLICNDVFNENTEQKKELCESIKKELFFEQESSGGNIMSNNSEQS